MTLRSPAAEALPRFRQERGGAPDGPQQRGPGRAQSKGASPPQQLAAVTSDLQRCWQASFAAAPPVRGQQPAVCMAGTDTGWVLCGLCLLDWLPMEWTQASYTDVVSQAVRPHHLLHNYCCLLQIGITRACHLHPTNRHLSKALASQRP